MIVFLLLSDRHGCDALDLLGGQTLGAVYADHHPAAYFGSRFSKVSHVSINLVNLASPLSLKWRRQVNNSR